MARTKISEFSATPANNTDIDSINIAEGCAPSGINDAIRELMAQLKDFQTGAVGDSFGGPVTGAVSGAVNATVGATTPNTGAFTTLTTTGNVTLGDAGTDTVLINGAPSIGGAGYGMGMGFRNRIINGDMRIDQRNAGAAVTPTAGTYTLDRYFYQLSQASKASTSPLVFLSMLSTLVSTSMSLS